jgi:uncharacterized membrane protein
VALGLWILCTWYFVKYCISLLIVTSLIIWLAVLCADVPSAAVFLISSSILRHSNVYRFVPVISSGRVCEFVCYLIYYQPANNCFLLKLLYRVVFVLSDETVLLSFLFCILCIV